MTPRFLETILRSLTDLGPPVGDAELLKRFVEQRCDSAFAELVRRHARLVWTVCRHLTASEADADDAFQASFLVLLQNAGKLRDGAKLSAWLHGVAHKVCSKARQSAKRRQGRESTVARHDCYGAQVPDSAWDRALAAVHEEVGRLPESLRVPFVMCCIEGRSVSDSAGQLGWKLGTFSGRLTRAKEAVVKRLEVRGLTVGAAVTVGLALPPVASTARAAALALVGVVASETVVQLAQGVIGMGIKPVKMLAAAIIVVCGLGLSVGVGRLSNASAQNPAQNQTPKEDAAAKIKRYQDDIARLQADLDARAKALAEAEKAARLTRDLALFQSAADDYYHSLLALQYAVRKENYTAKTTKWEYDLVAVSEMGQQKFFEFLQDRENRGWEYNGQTNILHDGKPTAMWMFRRPAAGAEYLKSSQLTDYFRHQGPTNPPAQGQSKPAIDKHSDPETIKKLESEQKLLLQLMAERKALEAQALLSRRSPLNANQPNRVVFKLGTYSMEPSELAKLLGKASKAKFGEGRATISSSEHGVAVEGDKEVLDWATNLVKLLGIKN